MLLTRQRRLSFAVFKIGSTVLAQILSVERVGGKDMREQKKTRGFLPADSDLVGRARKISVVSSTPDFCTGRFAFPSNRGALGVPRAVHNPTLGGAWGGAKPQQKVGEDSRLAQVSAFDIVRHL